MKRPRKPQGPQQEVVDTALLEEKMLTLWSECGYNVVRARARAVETGLVPDKYCAWKLTRSQGFEDVVRTYLEDLRQSSVISIGRVLAELSDVAYSSMDDFVEWTGGEGFVWAFDKASPNQRKAIQELTTETRMEKAEDGSWRPVTRTKVKLYDKLKALDKIGSFLKMWMRLNDGGDTGDQLSDEQRAERVAQLLETARARRAGRTVEGEATRVDAVPGPVPGDTSSSAAGPGEPS